MIKNKNSYIENGIETNRRIAVLVLVCNRVTVTRTLDQIFKYRPNAKSFPVILSQDCGDKGKGVSSLVRQKYDEKITYIVVSCVNILCTYVSMYLYNYHLLNQ